jgi:putative redox protein
MELKTVLTWHEEMHMSASNGIARVEMDARPEHGGQGKGQSPKELVLSGLAGCTGMDVIAILKKMRALPASLKIEVEADQTAEHPKVFSRIHIRYIATGVDREKLEKAVNLSQSQYCGVSAMLAKTASITHEILVD